MNPMMSYVDMVPDDDLNTRLKFYVSSDFSQKLQRSSVNNFRNKLKIDAKKVGAPMYRSNGFCFSRI